MMNENDLDSSGLKTKLLAVLFDIPWLGFIGNLIKIARKTIRGMAIAHSDEIVHRFRSSLKSGRLAPESLVDIDWNTGQRPPDCTIGTSARQLRPPKLPREMKTLIADLILDQSSAMLRK